MFLGGGARTSSGSGASTSSGGANSHGCHGLTADDLQVSEILLSLPRLIYSSIRWGTRKKRSVIKSHPSPTHRLLLPAPEIPKIKAEASSPTSPLALPVDSSNYLTKKAPKRKSAEELREKIAILEERQKVYIGELKKVRAYHKQLVDKIRGSVSDVKLPGLECTEEFSPKTGVPSASGDDHQSNTHENKPITGLGLSTTGLYHHPICQLGPSLPYAIGSHHPYNVGPVDIPDHNISYEEPSQPLDLFIKCRHCRAQRALEARWWRRLKLKEKRRKRVNSSLFLYD